ncbi:hypothetical protein DIPPA_35909 [Diplonema papillatum]|nr:hypothetical protein DIPPA_35909 [Diplonema papillatum]|eukprot:gene9650-14981_t
MGGKRKQPAKKTKTKKKPKKAKPSAPTPAAAEDLTVVVRSLDALLAECDEKDARVQREMQLLEEELEQSADDSEYWGRLYHAVSEEFGREDTAEEPEADLGIDRVLAKKEERNVVYYQVRWREHHVTWERADDISAARTLLTAFDEYLKAHPSQQHAVYAQGPPRLSKREKRKRRDLAETGGEPPVAEPPPTRQVQPQTAKKPAARPVVSKVDGGGYNADAALKAIKTLQKLAGDVERSCFTRGAVIGTWPARPIEHVAAVYADMIHAFRAEKYLAKYGGSAADLHLAEILPNAHVPAYFANAGGESIWCRKMLSILGLRNLVWKGREIFGEMREKLFTGNPAAYQGQTGPHKMKHFTGNVVDLDTTVLRCSDRLTLNAINEWNKRQQEPTFSSTGEFADSEQAKDIARNASSVLLTRFNEDFGLTTLQAMKNRQTDPSALAHEIPTARTNTDRGRWPCWRYSNCGVESFHANVPSIDDVNGALLKAPLHCALGWIQAKDDPDDFFENCVVDSCFNMKWKAIEEFNAGYEKQGSVNQVLEQVQADHQGVFNKIFDDDDDESTKEVAEMGRLAAGLQGRDKNGCLRAITAADIKAWVADPSRAI